MFPASDENDKKMQGRLRSHYARHHPGHYHSGSQPGQMPTLVTQVSADQDVAWKCEFCDHGVSLEAFTSAGANRMARDKMDHKKQHHPGPPSYLLEALAAVRLHRQSLGHHPNKAETERLRSMPKIPFWQGLTLFGGRSVTKPAKAFTVGRAVGVGLPSNGTSLRETTSRNAPAPEAGFLQPKRPRVVLADVQNCSSLRRRSSASGCQRSKVSRPSNTLRPSRPSPCCRVSDPCSLPEWHG